MSEKTVVFEDGNAYEKMTGVWSQIVGKEFIEWLNSAGGLSWVDIGCGTGAFTAQVAELCSPSHLLGIEPSEAQIEFARKRPIAHQVTFQTGDATALECESSSFDVATMALVLYFLPNPALGVNEMKRVVKPGGIIATYDWDVPGGGLPHEWLHKELRKRGIEYPLPPTPEVSRMDELEKLWDKAGLRSIECKQFRATRTFTNFKELWDISMKAPAFLGIFDDLAPEVISDIRSTVESELTKCSSGSVSIHAHANAIKGTF